MVNKVELRIFVVLREEKVAKPGKKKNKRVAAERSRWRGSRVWRRGCLVQEPLGKVPAGYKHHHLLAGWLFWTRLFWGALWEAIGALERWGGLITGCFVELCGAPWPCLMPAFSLTASFKAKMFAASKTFEGTRQVLRRIICSDQTCAPFYAYKCKVNERWFGNGAKRLSLWNSNLSLSFRPCHASYFTFKQLTGREIHDVS